MIGEMIEEMVGEMIKEIENWINYFNEESVDKMRDVYDRSRMERWKYIGNDTRLDAGKVYDLTVSRNENGKSYISVHVNLKARVYKQYDNPSEFRSEWVVPDAG